MTHKICDACETVAHCTNHGCIPIQQIRAAEAHHSDKGYSIGTREAYEAAVAQRNQPKQTTQISKQMTKFQFRSNWRGKLILQRLVKYRDQFGGPDYQWCDANVSDLKIYYQQLHNLPAPCNHVREQFDRECQ